MDKKKVDELMEQATQMGAILATMYFDAHGKEPQLVREALIAFVSKINNEKGIILSQGAVEEPIQSGDLWSSSAEVQILAQSYPALINIASKYGPIGVEILKPNKISLELNQAQDIVLSVSQLSQDFANYVLQKTMKPEEWEEMNRRLRQRASMGRNMLKQAGVKVEEPADSSEQAAVPE